MTGRGTPNAADLADFRGGTVLAMMLQHMGAMAHVRWATSIFVGMAFLAAAACGGKLVSEVETNPDPVIDPYHPVPTATATSTAVRPTPTFTSEPGPAPRPIATTYPTTTATATSTIPILPPPVPTYWYDGGTTLPVPTPASNLAWQSQAFTYDSSNSPCQGGLMFVAYNAKYNLWVGAEECTSTQYKLYLSDSPSDTFHQIVDWAGIGEDHCELVNPAFTNPSEDDITAGCPSCALGPIDASWPGPALVYARGWLGTPFTLETWPPQGNYTPTWYECGVSIP